MLRYSLSFRQYYSRVLSTAHVLCLDHICRAKCIRKNDEESLYMKVRTTSTHTQKQREKSNLFLVFFYLTFFLLF